MTASLSELIAQKNALERRIHAVQTSAKAEAINRVRSLMADHGLTALDIAERATAKRGAPSGKKVAAKYRDPASGATWSGRGLKPKWLASALAGGKSISDFAI